MRTGYLSALLVGLVCAATAAGQELPPPRPWSSQDALTDIVPAAKTQEVFPAPSLPPPTLLPPPTYIPSAPPFPGSAMPPGTEMPLGQPFGMVPEALPPEAPVGPEEPEGSVYPLSRFDVSATFLNWWVRGAQSTPIITTGSTADAVPGALGQPNTHIVAGNIDDHQARDGIRVNVGYALEPSWLAALEGNFLYLPSRFTHFVANANSTNGTVIARPFIDADTLAESAFVVNSPGTVQGTAFATAVTDLWGGEINMRIRQLHSPGFVINYLGGVRFAQLNDAIRIAEGSIGDAVDPTRADILFRADNFVSRNYFFGPQVGLELEWVSNNFTVNLNGKLAAGLTQENVSIAGATQGETFSGQWLTPINAGFLAAPTNIGNYSQGRFGMFGEMGITFAYQLTPNWRFSLGYSALYWNRVARADQQIDRVVNLTQATNTGTAAQLVGPTRPSFMFNDTEFWAQGVNFTVEFRY